MFFERSAKVSRSGAQILYVKLDWYLERNTFLAKYLYLECGSFFEDFPNHWVLPDSTYVLKMHVYIRKKKVKICLVPLG